MAAKQQQSWESLANNVAGREWETLRNVWSAAAQEFQPTAVSELSAAVEPLVASGFEVRPHVSVFNFEGGTVAAFHDAAAALAKCSYVLRTVGNCVLGGQPTWASVDAYHFSLLGCRALLSLLGVHIVHVGTTRCFLDMFPEGKLEQVRRGFKKAYKNYSAPARLVYRVQGGLIEQRGLWALLMRTLHITDLPSTAQKDAEIILKLGEGFGRTRNDMLYGNSSWLYGDAFKPTTTVSINDDIHSYSDIRAFFVEHRDANFAFAATLARLLSVLLIDVEAQSGVTVLASSYSNCFRRFSGFNAPVLNGIYSQLYRQEAYSVDI